jgi:hypothetical protein
MEGSCSWFINRRWHQHAALVTEVCTDSQISRTMEIFTSYRQSDGGTR